MKYVFYTAVWTIGLLTAVATAQVAPQPPIQVSAQSSIDQMRYQEALNALHISQNQLVDLAARYDVQAGEVADARAQFAKAAQERDYWHSYADGLAAPKAPAADPSAQ